MVTQLDTARFLGLTSAERLRWVFRHALRAGVRVVRFELPIEAYDQTERMAYAVERGYAVTPQGKLAIMIFGEPIPIVARLDSCLAQIHGIPMSGETRTLLWEQDMAMGDKPNV